MVVVVGGGGWVSCRQRQPLTCASPPGRCLSWVSEASFCRRLQGEMRGSDQADTGGGGGGTHGNSLSRGDGVPGTRVRTDGSDGSSGLPQPLS